MYTPTTFLNRIKSMCIEDMKKTGILASLTAAQAYLESNKGNSGLTVSANNLFGMKGRYSGQYVSMPTREYSAKTGYYTITASFRKYPSWAESIADHSGLFNRLDRYKNLRGEKDYKKACKYVQADGYATSPTYADSLIKIIETYHLYEWDKEAGGDTVKNPVLDSVVNDVIAGKFGNGKARKAALEALGYDYKEVQKEVNKRLKGA